VRHSECLLRAPRRPASAAAGLVAVGLTIVASVNLAPAVAATQGDDTTTTSSSVRGTPTEPTRTPTTEDAEATSIRGRLRFEGEPVEGAEVTVEQGGRLIGRVRSGPDGRWEVPVPEPGRYDVTLDTDTLPDGVGLRFEDRATLDQVGARRGAAKTVAFLLGERLTSGRTRTERLLNLAFDGLVIGFIIAVASVGLSLIFGITGLVNFAHGELVTFGALVAWYFNASAGGPGVALVGAAALAVVLSGLFGGALERGLWRPLRRRKTGLVQMLIVSIGLSLFLRHVYLILVGPSSRPYTDYTVQQALRVGPISSPPKDFWVVGISIAILIAIGFLLQRTRLGTAMRAVADERDLAEASGIDVQRIILVTWILGAGVAAVGGVFQGVTESVNYLMGFRLLLLMFAAVILGGLGTAYGAMVGGVVIGVVTQVSTYWIESELRLAVALAVLIVVLLVRPQGILGQSERVG
jgi:branched-chain amino acid transport system permease protein